jgi:Icc protein
MSRIACAFFLLLSLTACRANYRDWQAPDCTVEKPDLTILQFTDTHVRDEADGAWLADRLAAAIRQYHPDVLIHTGDITLKGHLGEWQAYAASVKNIRPYPELVWGNHDMPLKTSEFSQAGSTHVIDFGNYRLVLIDTAWEGPFVGSYTSIPENEFPALRKAAETEKFILLFAHHPLGKGAPHFRLNNAEAVLAIFAKRKLLAALTGHFHGAWLAPEGKVLFAGTAPLSSHQRNHTVSQSKGYRIVELQNGCLRTRHVQLD